MAGIRPIFVSAPKVRLKISGQTIAHAIGLSLSIDVNVENVFTFSRFDSAGPEALQYGLVSGSIQIVKLNSVPSNSVLKLPGDSGANSPYRLADHLDPLRVLASETFDFDILVNHFMQGAKVDSAIDKDPSDYGLYSIKDCRIGGSNINISLGALLNEPISFQGLLLIDSDDVATNGQESMSLDTSVADGT